MDFKQIMVAVYAVDAIFSLFLVKLFIKVIRGGKQREERCVGD